MGDSRRRQVNGLPPRGLGLVGGGEPRPTQVRDRLGRDLRPGDGLVLPNFDPKGQLWILEDIRPNLSPQAPPNTVILQLVNRTQVVVPVGAQVVEILRVIEAPEPPAEEEVPLPTDAELPREEEAAAPFTTDDHVVADLPKAED